MLPPNYVRERVPPLGLVGSCCCGGGRGTPPQPVGQLLLRQGYPPDIRKATAAAAPVVPLLSTVSFEGVCVTAVILATVRGEGRLRAAGRYVVLPGLPGLPGLPDEFQIVQSRCVFTAKMTRVTLRCNVFCFFLFHTPLI